MRQRHAFRKTHRQMIRHIATVALKCGQFHLKWYIHVVFCSESRRKRWVDRAVRCIGFRIHWKIWGFRCGHDVIKGLLSFLYQFGWFLLFNCTFFLFSSKACTLIHVNVVCHARLLVNADGILRPFGLIRLYAVRYLRFNMVTIG